MFACRLMLFLVLVGVAVIDCLFSSTSKTYFVRGRRFHKLTRSIDMGNITDQYYDQRLDHFNEALTTTWKQRYWVNDEFFQPSNGPVFLMIGGEGEENPIWMKNGQWINYAQKFNALCVMVEHRFYGKSHPTEDISTDNLSYLSSEQGLADLATFRQFIHDKYNLTDSNKWISFGGSYPGSLSAWFRLKYPHLVYGAISSSAPMLAIIDFTDYMVVVNNSLSKYSPKCTQQINNATQKVIDLMQTPEGKVALQKLFRTCAPLQSDDDVTNFYSLISGNFEGVVQYNKDNRAFEGAVDTNVTIDVLCDTMMNEDIGDSLRRYAAVNDIILNTYNQTCLDASYSNFIDQMKKTSWNDSASVGGRQWTYQTCIEFGFFQSTDSKMQPFGQTVPVDFYVKQCKDIFGDKFDIKLLQQSVDDTNTNYGGYDYEGSRVVFVNGEIDPWHALGFFKKPPNEFTQTVFIEGTAHCADMYPSGDKDLPSLVAAREQIVGFLSKWLNK